MRPPDPLTTAFGQHVRSLRRARGWTQADLAAYSGLCGDTVRRLEHGSFSPSLDTLRKLAEALGISVGTMLLAFETGEVTLEAELAQLLRTATPEARATVLRVARVLVNP